MTFAETKPNEASSQYPVQVKSLYKSFGQQKVLAGVDLHVARGQTVSILGRSGTGKSVLLKLMIGLHKPDSGSISIDGQEVTALEFDSLSGVRKKIGFLFQQAALYDSLTVEENVAFPLTRHTHLNDSKRKARVWELLSKVGMAKDAHKLPTAISGGMQRRVGLARALTLDPSILLFDEPTAGLDPITAAEIGELILQLQKERRITSVIVTHDIHAARAVSDRVALLKDGRILVEGTFTDFEKSNNAFAKQFLNGST